MVAGFFYREGDGRIFLRVEGRMDFSWSGTLLGWHNWIGCTAGEGKMPVNNRQLHCRVKNQSILNIEWCRSNPPCIPTLQSGKIRLGGELCL